MNDSLAIWMLV